MDCLPGATAFVPALVNSGLPCERFIFEGFLPQKKGRQTKLKSLAQVDCTMLFYESPHRLLKALNEFITIFGPDRKASVSREITKMFEETKRGTLEEINTYFTCLEDRFPQYIYGSEEDTLPSVIGKLLIAKELTIGTVESCTAGAISKSIVSVAGSSAYFQGSILTYSNELKKKLVNVTSESLDNYGAVSREVIEQMAINGREILGVDWCISTSGVAGPDGGTDEKPVGTIWIAIANKENVFSKQFNFGNNRERNIEMAVLTALNLARCKILGILSEKN